MNLRIFFLSSLVSITALQGCGFSIPQAPKEALATEATLATDTKTAKLLRRLPPPEQQLAVAVYEFGDYTGQNKPADMPQYSRAVTQGGVAIIKKALLDAGSHKWFHVLERGGLNNLLQERKIINTMREGFTDQNGKALPALGPMLYAGLLLEGGIVSYESNVMTGGAGARYLGIGGNTEYSRDMVTVYLRLVSVKTGEVLLSVNASKTIYSQALQGGIFKFVAYDKIVEGEAGVTYNEPPQLAVRQAIELAVYSMIMEGTDQGLWSFQDRLIGNKLLKKYYRQFKGIDYIPVKRETANVSPRQEETEEWS